MNEQRREQNQRSVVEKRDREVEVTITADRRVEKKYESGQTECRKVKHVRRAAALFEEHEETDAQENDADEIDVQHARRPLVNRAELVEVGPVSAHVGRVGRPLHQVMQAAADACLFEINLDVACGSNLFSPAAAVEADAEQLIAGKQPGAVRRGTLFDTPGDDAVMSVYPLDAVPGWCFVFDALAEVEQAGTDQ